MRERDVEAYFVKRVNLFGGEVRKVRWIGRRGAPDRYAMFPSGDAWWVELKAPGKKPSAAQAREHRRLARFGQRVVVLDSIAAVDSWFGDYTP